MQKEGKTLSQKMTFFFTKKEIPGQARNDVNVLDR